MIDTEARNAEGVLDDIFQGAGQRGLRHQGVRDEMGRGFDPAPIPLRQLDQKRLWDLPLRGMWILVQKRLLELAVPKPKAVVDHRLGHGVGCLAVGTDGQIKSGDDVDGVDPAPGSEGSLPNVR